MESSVCTPEVGSRPVWSHSCTLDDLVVPYAIDPRIAGLLESGQGWARRWTVTWKTAQADVICPVRELAAVPAGQTVPVRRFSWRPGQRHRPGLQHMVSTRRMHGFESLAERRLLLALDFAGDVEEVLAQPFRLRFASAEGMGEHTPDFLVLLSGTALLLDVRPAHLIEAEDVLKFAAAAQTAAAVGWHYAVVTGWRREVMTGLDTLSARRRKLTDRLGLHAQLLGLVGERPHEFGDLVEATSIPAVARVHAIHLLWHRRLAVDLAQPLGDGAWVYPAGRP
jgi:hypothetical protein